jgi:hypothetical protein
LLRTFEAGGALASHVGHSAFWRMIAAFECARDLKRFHLIYLVGFPYLFGTLALLLLTLENRSGHIEIVWGFGS